MKKAIFLLVSCNNTKFNEFESCRGEGRTVMNMAFGFSLLGYESYIVNNWNITEPKKIWNNVYITNKPDENIIHDIAFAYDDIIHLNRINCRHKILMTYAHLENIMDSIKENNIKEVTLVCPVPSFMSIEIVKNNMQFFPALFPIPSINVGFIPYKYEPKLPKLKVYIFHSAWAGSHLRNQYYLNKQILVLDYLKAMKYDLEPFIHVENKQIIENCKTLYETSKYNKVHFIDNEGLNYDDILNVLKNVDLCITGGGGLDMYGSSVVDMISLGKPIICLVDGFRNPIINELEGKPQRRICLNNFYNCSEHLIICQESFHESINKLNKIFDNLEESYNDYKKQLEFLEFKNWKITIENFLKRNYDL